MINRDNERDLEREDENNERVEAMLDQDAAEEIFAQDNEQNTDVSLNEEYHDDLTDIIKNLENNRISSLDLTDVTIVERQFNRLCKAIEKGGNFLQEITYSADACVFEGFDETTDVISGKLFESFSKCTNLTGIDLEATDISNDNIHLIIDLIRNNPRLTYLKFKDCNMNSQVLLTLASAFAKAEIFSDSQIEVIDLSGNNFDLMSLKQLTTNLKNIKSIKNLDLYNSHIDDEMMISITDLIVNRNLKNICLNNNNISHNGIKHLCDALTQTQIKNPMIIRPISLNLISNPIGEKGLLVLADFIENGGQLSKLYFSVSENDDVKDESLIALIAAANKNFYLKVLSCVSRANWNSSVLTTVTNQLKSNSRLISINLGVWENSLSIDLLKYNFTLRHIFGWRPINDVIHSDKIKLNARTRIDLSLAMNTLLSQLLNTFVFANIDSANLVFLIMEIKQLLAKDHIPQPLLDIFTSILSTYDLGNSVIVNLKPKDKLIVLKAMRNILKTAHSSKYNEDLQKFCKIYSFLVTTKLKNNPALHQDNNKKAINVSSAINQAVNQLIKNCNDEALEFAKTNTSVTQPQALIPTIALQLPSLKDLCYHVVALQIINEQSYVLLGSLKSFLPIDLAGELDHIPRLLPQLTACNANPIFKVNQANLSPTLFTWKGKNFGIELLPANEDGKEDAKEDEQDKNDDVVRGLSGPRKESKNEPIVTLKLRLGNSKH